MDVIIDDHLLLQLLLDEEPPDLRLPGARVFATGLWYHRLCRALNNPSVAGVLSRSLGRAVPSVATSALRSIAYLPETVGLISLRELAWPMARLLDEGVRLNLMSLEALAAAELLGAELCLAAIDENPPLIDAALARGMPARLVTERS
ncbi:MAG TPA: hypothetical protein VHU85_14180 [Acidimicrobiales bacterium]|jgi:hypothetical protein|nr:hypothetical protein [Acidimicrobiales bacterium]